jgi:hypothetical protein
MAEGGYKPIGSNGTGSYRGVISSNLKTGSDFRIRVQRISHPTISYNEQQVLQYHFNLTKNKSTPRKHKSHCSGNYRLIILICFIEILCNNRLSCH